MGGRGERGPLDDYERKRNFRRTPEPAPEEVGGRRGAFVVHRHEARRLHYDLRLERDGVLWSWAVPKGFSYDPRDKHLAVRTEDHPLAYLEFSGVIPKGEYGAGTMTLWDRGHVEWVDEGALARGEVKVRLFGRRLRGEWHLVQTSVASNSWLLFKSKDRYAGPRRDTYLGVDFSAVPQGPLPRTVRRMRASVGGEVFADPEWLFEVSFEGARVLAEKRRSQVRLRGLRRSLPWLEREFEGLAAEEALLDGVLVAVDAAGRPAPAELPARLRQGRGEGLVYYAFDLLHVEGFDVRGLALVERKRALRALLPDSPRLLYCDHVVGKGPALADAAFQEGIEALIAKRLDAVYRGGVSQAWRKLSARPSGGSRTREGHPFRPSNVEKVYWPGEGFTKGDLLAYYDAVADDLLAYLRGRPLHLHRFPDGIEGKSFYQKDARPQTPEWVRTAVVASRHGERPIRYVICEDRETLLYLVNSGSIDLHPWMSRLEDPEHPDWAVIDLDPKEAPFGDVVRIAREVGRVLRGVGLEGCLKTSGKTGLHVFLGLDGAYTYRQASMFCEGVARIVARELPGIATVERSIAQREGKVYVDYGQNRRGQTVVPPYVVRPVPGACVSTPLAWDELDADLHPTHHTIESVPARLARLGDLFRRVLTRPQDLAAAVERLEDYLRSR